MSDTDDVTATDLAANEVKTWFTISLDPNVYNCLNSSSITRTTISNTTTVIEPAAETVTVPPADTSG